LQSIGTLGSPPIKVPSVPLVPKDLESRFSHRFQRPSALAFLFPELSLPGFFYFFSRDRPVFCPWFHFFFCRHRVGLFTNGVRLNVTFFFLPPRLTPFFSLPPSIRFSGLFRQVPPKVQPSQPFLRGPFPCFPQPRDALPPPAHLGLVHLLVCDSPFFFSPFLSKPLGAFPWPLK